MEKSSILHQSDSKYSFPVGGTAAVLRLRTKRNDTIKSVVVIWNTAHKFWQEQLRQKMEIGFSDQLFDYYVTTIDNGYPGYSYIFEITDSDGQVYYYNESGISQTLYIKEAFMDNFTVVYPNENDIVKPNKAFSGRVFYQIFPERFACSDTTKPYITMDWYTEEPRNELFAGGDLTGIMQKLPYLKDLGIGAIYMTPIHPSPSAHKYDINDYFDVDKMFGSVEILKQMVKKAHELDIKVVMDLVFNHSGYYNPIFQDVVKNNKDSKYYNWYFVETDEAPEWNKLNYKTFCDVPSMPKLNTNNPLVQEYLTSVGRFYIQNCDVDGYRLDVAFDVSHDFWRYFKSELKKLKKDIFLIGEDWQNSESFLGNDQWDSVMNYPFLYACQRFLAKNRYTPADFSDYLNSALMRYKDGLNANMLNLLDSHDIERFANTVNFDKNLHLLAIAMMIFYPGCPMLYYGDEIFMEGKQDPYNRKCMRWNSKEFESKEHQVVKDLLKMRQNDLLKAGSVKIYEKSDVVYIKRFCGTNSLILAVNHSGKDRKVKGDIVYGYRNKDNTIKNNGFVVIKEN